jgi:protein-tyrosine phosphatase
MKTPIGVSREVNQLSRIKDPESPARRGFLKASLGYFMLPALSTPWLVSCGGSSSSIAPTPRLTSVNNFRDVAGTSDQEAYSTSNGRKLRRGVIYRSNVLTPSPTDLATLNTLNIRADYDLRTPGEIKLQPDSPLAGASYLNVNLIGTPTNPTPNLASAADGISFMENSYTELVTDSGVRDRLAQLFQKLATTSDSQVYHCSGGKDRTGWVTTILLNVIGVPQDVIIQDYMLTNVYSEASIQNSYQQMITTYGQSFADAYYPTLIADARYLNAALNQAVTSYGTMASYINDNNGIGLSSIVQTQLRNKFLN